MLACSVHVKGNAINLPGTVSNNIFYFSRKILFYRNRHIQPAFRDPFAQLQIVAEVLPIRILSNNKVDKWKLISLMLAFVS